MTSINTCPSVTTLAGDDLYCVLYCTVYCTVLCSAHSPQRDEGPPRGHRAQGLRGPPLLALLRHRPRRTRPLQSAHRRGQRQYLAVVIALFITTYNGNGKDLMIHS